MERRVNYIMVSLFSLLMIAGFIGFVIWAHMRTGSKPVEEYTVYFDQAVNGLSIGSNVRYLGVSVGQVEAIELDTSGTLPRVKVTAGIDKGVPIFQGTIAFLKPSGITGVSFIDLSTDPKNTAPLEHPEGTAPVIPSQGSSIDKLFEGANNSMARLDKLLSDENITRINETFANLDRMSGRIDAMIAKHDAAITRLLGPDMDDLDETLRSTRKAMDALTGLTLSLKENPSQLLFPKTPQGVKIAP